MQHISFHQSQKRDLIPPKQRLNLKSWISGSHHHKCRPWCDEVFDSGLNIALLFASSLYCTSAEARASSA
jgi:hypothetical protein